MNAKSKATTVAVVAGIAGAVPGLNVLIGGSRVPPGLKYSFAIGSWACASIVVLVLLAYRRELFPTVRPKVLRYAGLSLAGFLITLIGSLYLQNKCLIDLPNAQKGYNNGAPLYFPLWLDGNIAHLVEQSGSRKNVIGDHGAGGIDDELKKMPCANFAWTCTTAVMLLTFVVNASSIALAFGSLGFHLVPPDDRSARLDLPSLEKRLPGALFTQLQHAIVAAFNNNDLEQLMRQRMDVSLWAVIDKGPGGEVAFHLIEWVLQRDRLPEFLTAVEAERPLSQEIQRAVTDVRSHLNAVPAGAQPGVVA